MRAAMALVSIAMSVWPVSIAADSEPSLELTIRGGDIVVPVQINGAGPFVFVLDTGSSRSVVSQRVATALALPRSAMTQWATAAGTARMPLLAVDRLELAGSVTSRLEIVALSVDLRAAGRPVDGIVGQDVLAERVYTIDYSSRRFRWDPAPAAAHNRLPLRITNGRALVTLEQQPKRRPLEMIPDSGADGLVLFARDRAAMPPLTPLDAVMFRSLSGTRVARRALIEQLRLGRVTLRNQMALVVQPEQSDAWLGDGLLPLHVFTSVTFNGPAGWVAVADR